VTQMLEHNNYVRCLMIDFSKAFDTADHVIHVLLSKLVQLKLPGFVINWICSFLSGRGQQCKVNGALSDRICRTYSLALALCKALALAKLYTWLWRVIFALSHYSTVILF